MRYLPNPRFSLLLLLLLAACAPAEDPVTLRPATIEEFVERLASDLEEHEWQSILAAADPTLYRSRVVEARVAEPAFVAETLGIVSEQDRIQEGEELGWDDFERIETAELVATPGQGAPYVITGAVTLETGEVLRISANATQVQGRFVLTSATD